jgi:hypothetical protein
MVAATVDEYIDMPSPRATCDFRTMTNPAQPHCLGRSCASQGHAANGRAESDETLASVGQRPRQTDARW